MNAPSPSDACNDPPDKRLANAAAEVMAKMGRGDPLTIADRRIYRRAQALGLANFSIPLPALPPKPAKQRNVSTRKGPLEPHDIAASLTSEQQTAFVRKLAQAAGIPLLPRNPPK